MTLIAHDSAYFAELSVLQLFSELALAASRLANSRLSEARPDGWPAICRECGAESRVDLLHIPHLDTCNTGAVARVLYALACREVEQSLVAPHLTTRKEAEAQQVDATESAAARETRPRILPFVRRGVRGLYGEPWAVDETGAVHNAAGNTIADPVGCELVEPDDAIAMRRMVACVNACDGISSSHLARDARAIHVAPRVVPFDLEKAQAGARVVTRDGAAVTDLRLDEQRSHYKLRGMVNGVSLSWTREGMRWSMAGGEHRETADDLMIAEDAHDRRAAEIGGAL